MTIINMIQLTQHEHINPTILACNMMTLYALFILLGLSRNHHTQHLPTSDITRSSQDQIKLGINNTVVISKWPQGAWPLPTTLVQHHEYTTTRYPRYHGDHSRIINGTTLGSTAYLVTKRWSFRRSQPTYLIIELGLSLIKLLLILLTHGVTDTNWAFIRGRGYR